MGKVIVAILATFTVLSIMVYFFGTLVQATAVTVPGTTHTPSLSFSWYFVIGLGVCYFMWSVVKGK